MQITIRDLRCLIREALAEDKSVTFVEQILSLSDDYVRSLVGGHRNSSVATELVDVIDNAESYGRWLLSKHEPNAEYFYRFVEKAIEFAKSTKFWKTPVFFGRDEHVEDMQRKLKRLHSLALPVQSRLRAA